MYRLMIWFTLAVLVFGPGVAAAAPVPRPDLQGPDMVQNEFIRAYINERGQFTIGTRGGDPATGFDDDKRLMYGYGEQEYTSLTSVRIIEGGQTVDVPLTRPATRSSAGSGGEVTTRWQVGGLIVEQNLEATNNPFTGRADTFKITTRASNGSDHVLQAGARVMIDTMIGENDNAPFFVPGTGNTAQEQEYKGAEIPPYWKAFEATDYKADSLKGQGIVTGFDATPPDRFLLARWPRIKNTIWDYEITPGAPLGDSAVAMYWLPKEIAPGASMAWVTYYGLAGSGGGSAWIDAPVNVTSQAPEFQATLWVSNRSDADFTGGQARITWPAGLRPAAGESETKPMPTVPAGGGAQSVTWRLVAGGETDADHPYTATVVFAGGSEPLSAAASIHYQFVAPTAAPPTGTPVAIAPIAAPPPAARGLPWWPWLLLIPLVGIPLLLLRRSRPTRPVAAPPMHPRPAPPIMPERPTPRPGPSGADVTHGRGKPGKSKSE